MIEIIHGEALDHLPRFAGQAALGIDRSEVAVRYTRERLAQARTEAA